jgi:hypothetical protein
MVIRSIILFSLLCVNQNLQAQDSSIRQRKFNRSFFAIPSLGSSPETGFFGGASGTLDLAPLADSTARHSVLGAEITGTAKKQFILALRWDVTNHDYILFGENSWMKFPELYWGIGARTPDENELLYDAYRIEMENGLYRRMGKNLYAGLDQQLQAVYSMSIPEADKAPDVIRMQLNTGIASGFGIGVLFDSRSNLLNPRAGEYLMMLHGLYFSKWFGSDYGFPHAHTDFRCYLPAGGKNILALQTTAEFFGDGAPFRLQAMLGGSMMMRGLYQGRYRDQNQITAQAEYRMICWKWIGAAAFAAAGNVFSVKHPERNGSIRTSAGLGLRFRVDKRENTNIRLDYGWVNDGSRGFYLSFGEAF